MRKNSTLPAALIVWLLITTLALSGQTRVNLRPGNSLQTEAAEARLKARAAEARLKEEARKVKQQEQTRRAGLMGAIPKPAGIAARLLRSGEDRTTSSVTYTADGDKQSKYEYAYDADGRQTMLVSYTWTGDDWQLLSKYEYTYDANGREIMFVSYIWTDGDWAGSDKYEYTYDANGREIMFVSYIWTDGDWVESNKSEYAYDANGREIMYATYIWTDGDWVGSYKSEYAYDANGRQTMYAYYNGWANGDWVGSYKSEYAYDANGREIMYAYYNWADGDWVGNYKSEYAYDANGRETMQVSYIWADGDWVGNYKSEYAYDAAGRQTMYAYYNWADGDWAIRERRTYDNEDPVYADNIYVTTITLTDYYGESVFEGRGIGINIPRYGIYSPFTHSGAGDVVYDSEVDGAGCLTKLTAYYQTDGNRDELYSGEMEYRDGRLTDFTTTIAGEGHIRNKIVRQYNDAGQQTLNEIYYWNYETNSLEISGKQVYAYDDAGRQTLYEYYWWNYSTNRLEADYKQVYAYDEAGRQILYEYYYGDGIGLGWELSSRDVYAYNEAGQQTLYGYYSPHDDYGYKWEREYDADGYESSYANYYWDAAGSAWAGRNKEVYTERNEQNNIIITTLYSWNINRWEKSRYRIEYPDATQTAPVALKPVLFEVSSACEASYPLRLESLLPGISGFGALSYDILMVDDPDDIAGDIGYTDEELTIPIRQTASNGQEAFISVLITSENYSQFVVTVRVTATGKTWVNISATMEGGVYNGQPYEFDGPIVTTNLEGEPLTLGIAIAYETEGGSRSETPPVNAGNYKLILYPENEAGYAGSLSVDFSITQRPIQIAAEDKTVQTGGALPAFTYKVEGAIAGETAITGAPVLSSPTANLSVAATYPIVVDLTGVTPTGNYQFADNAAVAGTLTVTGTPPVAVNGVTLNVSEAALAVAETIQLIATVSPANADNKGITWQTSDDAVAAVAADGTVTALAPGTAVITVITNDGGYSAICTITVTDSSVGVEQIAQEPAVFFYESTLTVNSPASETITVYSFNGLRLFQAKKPQGKAVFTIANPAGQRFVIVTGSSGWTTKTAR